MTTNYPLLTDLKKEIDNIKRDLHQIDNIKKDLDSQYGKIVDLQRFKLTINNQGNGHRSEIDDISARLERIEAHIFPEEAGQPRALSRFRQPKISTRKRSSRKQLKRSTIKRQRAKRAAVQ